MKLKTYTSDDFSLARCVNCSWVQDKNPKKAKTEKCSHCGETGYSYFPGAQSSHILGGMIHFIDSYNQKITSPRHIFPPQCYLPIIFACSNYETLLSDLVNLLIKKYGNYIGKLGRIMIFEDKYDRRENETLFKRLTLKSVQDAVQKEYPDFFKGMLELYKIRNHVVHGKDIDDTEKALLYPNKAIELLLMSVHVFKHLNNTYIVDFEKNVDYKKILRLGSHESFNP